MDGFMVWYKKRINEIWWAMGLLVVLFLCVPYVVLGQHSFVDIHDQLDGEVINYIYQAKYLFSGLDIIPEFMNGMDKSAMTVPAPAAVLFFKLFSPFVAFALMHTMSILIGYFGMFALSQELTKRPFISFWVAGLFAYLNFYPVYGLSCYGQPLLIWAFIRLFQKKKIGFSLLCIVVYGLFSSLALVGFVCLGIAFVATVLTWKRSKWVAGGFGVLLCSYLMGNLNLLKGPDYAVHREEMVIYAISDLGLKFKELLLTDAGYCHTDNTWILVLVIGVLVLYPVKLVWKRAQTKEKQKASLMYFILVLLFLLVLCFAGFGIIWQSKLIVDVRNELGGFLKYFQFNRVTWVIQTCWYVMLAVALTIFLDEVDFDSVRASWKFIWRYALVVLFLVPLSLMVYENSTIWHNLRLMIFPDTYKLDNWESYYSKEVYEEVEEYIGENQADYRVVSLGINPAAALYNGFYCLDGYSNYYSLEYKHEFRKMMAEELVENEACRLYFDEWGNRCYLMNSETGYNMWINKYNGGSYKDLNLDTEHLYEMGGRYVFSALPIDNATELGLALAREMPFEAESCMYRIYLYEVTP